MRAGLAARPSDWRWSSVHAQLGGTSDRLTAVAPVAARYPDFAALLASGEDPDTSERLRRAERVGRPLGDPAFLDRLAALTGRRVEPGRPGPRPRSVAAASPSPQPR